MIGKKVRMNWKTDIKYISVYDTLTYENFYIEYNSYVRDLEKIIETNGSYAYKKEHEYLMYLIHTLLGKESIDDNFLYTIWLHAYYTSIGNGPQVTKYSHLVFRMLRHLKEELKNGKEKAADAYIEQQFSAYLNNT